MKDKVAGVVKDILILGLSILSITLLYMYKGKAYTPDKTLPVLQDTSTTPEFHNQTAEEGLSSALTHYGLYHPDIVYAQAVLETGHFKSNLCINNNNLFGLYNSKTKKFYKFNSWYESVAAYKKLVQRRYKPPEDYYEFLSRIHYASDPTYVSKLKQIVKKENDKRRYAERDSLS